METFIQEVAQAIQKDYRIDENLTIVFPNKKATQYFKKEIAKGITSPCWSPQIITIEEWINSFSTLQEEDKITLLFKLYHSYKKITHFTEPIDRFYFWGDMLLRDFDELDKQLVNVELLFREVNNLKEIDQHFDYITAEQKKFLSDFWKTIEFGTPESKEKFLSLWKNLFPVYVDFKNTLSQEGIAYTGMIHREVANNFNQSNISLPVSQVAFVGFNALTLAEEKILSWFVENKNAKMYWDEDEYYVNTDYREAGMFFRHYRKHPILGKTFSPNLPAHLSKNRGITITEVGSKTAQPKLLTTRLHTVENGAASNSTVVVLPDETLLMPLLYSLPESVDQVNISMGYSVVNTPYFSLIDSLFDLHKTKRKEEFYFQEVLLVLHHPYIKSIAGKDVEWAIKEIEEKNRTYIEVDFFQDKHTFLQCVFNRVSENTMLLYLDEVLVQVTIYSTDLVKKEFSVYFHNLLTKLINVTQHEPISVLMLQSLFRQIAHFEKVPFLNNSISGLQIMGLLETRNLDFEHVHILSMNEGICPIAQTKVSSLPYSIRKAYQLPTGEHQDAMYAYLFYRLLQRSNNVNLYFSTVTDTLGSGEMSRYIFQILYETQWPYKKNNLYNPVQCTRSVPICINKEADVVSKLEQYKTKLFSPSSLNTYLECRLKFYFKNILGLKENNEVEESADPRLFGNMFHYLMQSFYQDIKRTKGHWQIEKTDYDGLEQKMDELIERAYRHYFFYAPTKKVVYEGQEVIVNEVLKKMTLQIFHLDRAYTPFKIEGLEENRLTTTFYVDSQLSVQIGGTLDRVDKKVDTKNKVDIIRVIDYKTGAGENAISSIKSLFAHHDKKRNKAVFQIILYAWIYHRINTSANIQLVPGLLNRKDIGDKNFVFGLTIDRQTIQDITFYLTEFETHLRELLLEIFDVNQPFDQTTEEAICTYCTYRAICRR